ncbi:MAG: transglutaminase domain-containing protein [Candidatus Zixiibacteriota bacterium]
MIKTLPGLCLAILLFWIVPASAETPPEVSFFKKIEYTIKEKDGDYKLSSRVEYEYVFLTERSTETEGFVVDEFFYNDVSEPKAKINGKGISGYLINSYILEGRDIFLSGSKFYGIRLPGSIEVNDTVRYWYREKFTDIAFLPILDIPNEGHLSVCSLDIIHPEEITIEFEPFFPFGPIPFKVDRPDAERTVLTFSDVDPRDTLDQFQYNDLLAAVLITVKHGDRYITPTTAETFVRWYEKMTSLKPGLDSLHQNLLAEELAEVSGDLEKLEIIYDFVRKNIRYIADQRSVHSIIPHAPSQVYDLLYGDCKDRASLVSAIARQYGLDVDMALINVNSRPRFVGNHAWLYDHMICYFENADTALFFDPTQRYLPFGYLIDRVIGKRALILNGDNPRFITIEETHDEPELSVNIRGNLLHLDSAEATIELRGGFAGSASYALETFTGSNLQNYFMNVITSMFTKISLNDFAPGESGDKTSVLQAVGDLSKFFVATDSRLYVPKTPFSILGRSLMERENDNLPIQPDGIMRMQLSITVAVDSIYRFAADSAISVYSNPAEYRTYMTPIGSDSVCFRYEYLRPHKDISGRGKEQFLDMAKWYKKLKTDMFILNREG